MIIAASGIVLGCSGAPPGSVEQMAVEHIQGVSTHKGLTFGARCQNDFQNGWSPHIESYAMCNSFMTTMSRTATPSFYSTLEDTPDAPASAGFVSGTAQETSASAGGVDSVQLFLVDTHANAALAYDAQLGMWTQGEYVHSSQLRFGSGTLVFALYGCDAFRTSDGHFWDRWINAFSGGLKIGLGAHGLVYDDAPQKGGELASRLQAGEPIGQAWNEAVWYANNNNTPTSAASGVDASDCWNRMGMTMATAQTTPALRDGQIGYLCWTEWTGS